MSTTAMARRRRAEHALLGIIVITAGVLRFGWARFANLDGPLHLDATTYDLLARGLSLGGGFVTFDGAPTAYFAPGYPWLLSVVYRMAGPHRVASWALNATCGAVTCALTYVLGKRLFGSTAGLVAAALFAFLPDDIFFAGLTLSEPVFGTMFTAVLYLLVRWSDPDAIGTPWRWVVFGLLLGGAGLVRGVALPFAAVPITFWALSRDHRPDAWKRSAALVLAVAITVLPWVIRNTIRMGIPVFSNDSSSAFWQRHCEAAFGGHDLSTMTAWEKEFAHLLALPNPTREIEGAKAELRAGLRYLVTHPRREISLILPTIGYLFEHGHAAFEFSKSYRTTGDGEAWIVFSRARDRIWEAVADTYFFIVLALAGIALPMVLFDPKRLGWILVLTIALFLCLHGVLFFSEPRYHSPLTPILAVMAAATLVRAWRVMIPSTSSAAGSMASG